MSRKALPGHILDLYPFISPAVARTLLRVTTAGLFMAHAIGRILIAGSISSFAAFMEHAGFAYGRLWVWGITLTELACGTLLVIGVKVRWAALPLFAIASTGILLIHRHLGWWVGEHGTGGSEYSVALMIMLIVVAVNDKDPHFVRA